MSRLRVVIVDDEELARNVVTEYLAGQPDVTVVGECANGFEAVKAVTDLKPDLVLLDVQMPKLNGFEVVELIGRDQAVVFVTAFDEYALKAFEVHAVDYLLKPFDRDRLLEALDRARARIDRHDTTPVDGLVGQTRPRPAERVLIRDGARVHILPVDAIDYVQAQDDYVSVQSGGRAYLKEQTLADLESSLDPKRFLRIHRSYLLNVDRLARVEQTPRETRVAVPEGRDDSAREPQRVWQDSATTRPVSMRVLVIGGTGFIGRFVVDALLRLGHEVAVVHRGSQSRELPGATQIIVPRDRLADAAPRLRAFAPRIVVDMILSSGRQAEALLDTFRGHAERIVAISSMDVYRACGVLHGTEPGPLEPLPLTESSPVRTRLQTYPPAQVRMLQQVFGWLDEHYDKVPVERAILGDPQLPGTILRLPMVYGPGDRLRRFYPVVKRILDGRRVLLFSESMAQWRATKGYVEDVARAIATAAAEQQSAGRIFNVGEPDTLTELEWAQQVARAMDWNGEFVVRPDDQVPPHLRAPGNAAQHWVADTRRIREELGFHESRSRDLAVRRTAEWERQTPPTGFHPHQFDYDAEDAALKA